MALSTATTFQFRAMVLAVSAACTGFSAHAQENVSSKSSSAIRDLPYSLSIVPAQLLQEQAAVTLDASIQNVAGLTQNSYQNYGYFNNYLLRGLPVKFLRDGLPDGPSVNGYTRNVNDIQQIEIVKGPGSVMPGATAPGGVINLITKKPASTPAHLLELGAGSFNAHRAKVDLTGPIDKDINYRLIGSFSNIDGDRGDGNKTIEVLPSFTIRSDNDQMTTIDIRHFDSKIQNDSVGIPFQNQRLINQSQKHRYYTPFSESLSELNSFAVKHEMKLDADWALRANYMYGKRDLDVLRNMSTWKLNDPVSGKQMLDRSWLDQKDRLSDSAAQLEAIWKGSFGSTQHEILFGAGWNQTEGVTTRKQALLAPISDIFAPVFPEKTNAELDQVLAWRREVKNVQTSVYVQDQVRLSKQFTLLAGLRYDNNTIDDNGDYNSLIDSGSAFLTTLATNLQSFKSKPPTMKREGAKIGVHKVNPSFGAVYQPTETSSFYIGASSGSASNFTTEIARTAYSPETSKQLEIGTKSVFLNGKLATNFAIFETRRNDFFDTANGLAGALGSSKSQGAEIEVLARPVSGLQMRMTYASQKAVHTKYVNATTKVDDLSIVGKRVPGTSKNQLSLWSTYDFQGQSLSGFGVGGGVNYRDAFYADAKNTNLAPAKPVLDLLAYYRGKRFDVQLNVANATNAKWYRYATSEGAIAPGNARSANLTTRFKF